MSDVILLKEHSLKEQINVNRKALRIFCFLKGDPKYLYFVYGLSAATKYYPKKS